MLPHCGDGHAAEEGLNKGTEYTDTVTLGSGIVIKKQSIGVASSVGSLPLYLSGLVLMYSLLGPRIQRCRWYPRVSSLRSQASLESV